jgi:hypothetical protein
MRYLLYINIAKVSKAYLAVLWINIISIQKPKQSKLSLLPELIEMWVMYVQ